MKLTDESLKSPSLPPPAGDALIASPYWRPPDDAVAVVVGDQVLVFRDAHYPKPQCVALWRRGKRCPGSLYSFGDHEGSVYIAGAEQRLDVRVPDRDEAWLRQRCEDCLDSDAPDAAAPEWTLFDPVADADLIRPVSPLWTPAGLVRRRREKESGDLELVPGPTLDELRALIPEASALPAVATALYRWFDADELLLYIGISDDLAGRTADHIKASSWMDFAASAKIERFPTRRDAAMAETAAIKAEQPLFNDRHNRSPEAQLRLVEYLVKHGRADLLAPAVSRG